MIQYCRFTRIYVQSKETGVEVTTQGPRRMVITVVDREPIAPQALMIEVIDLEITLRESLERKERLYLGDIMFKHKRLQPTFIMRPDAIGGLTKILGSKNVALIRQILALRRKLRIPAAEIEGSYAPITKVGVEIELDGKWVAMMETTLNIALKVR